MRFEVAEGRPSFLDERLEERPQDARRAALLFLEGVLEEAVNRKEEGLFLSCGRGGALSECPSRIGSELGAVLGIAHGEEPEVPDRLRGREGGAAHRKRQRHLFHLGEEGDRL
jgi:hypothetical protein